MKTNLEGAGAPADVILLYDGLCGFCDRTVQFALKRDHARVIHFAPLQGETAKALLSHYQALRGVDSLILVERDGKAERVSVRSDGVLRLLRYLGWWRVFGVLRVVPRFLRDACYDAFARVRYQIFGRYESCPIPAPEIRARFLS